LSLILIVLALTVVPFTTVLLIGRVAVVIGVGAALAIIEWAWAYSDSSDPASGSEWTGVALVAWTGLFALIGFSLWVAGATVGAAARQRVNRGRV
jgi:hypothetical protein